MNFNDFSGVNKRMLSISLALFGDLNVVLLDEPTTGMDLLMIQNLRNLITVLKEDGKSILLASNSTEECEALCNRMAVLIDGKCQCLGSMLHLKNRFCRGFELNIKVNSGE